MSPTGSLNGSDPSTRAVVMSCPYCSDEQLRPEPLPDAPYAWSCRSCHRVFSVRFHGLAGSASASSARATS